MSVAENLADVRSRIEAAAQRAGRDPSSVHLLAVSKLQPPDKIVQAHAAGHRDFGENYAQELRDKAVALKELAGIRWHAIGPLQTNKVKYVAGTAHAFHALDRLEIAKELHKRRPPELPPLLCFVEVNVGGEATKSGLSPEALPAFLDAVRPLDRLTVVGLMTLPPLQETEDAVRPFFQKLKALADAHGLKELSMGTTSDYEAAIAEGATWVRVGTALFGARAPKT